MATRGSRGSRACIAGQASSVGGDRATEAYLFVRCALVSGHDPGAAARPPARQERAIVSSERRPTARAFVEAYRRVRTAEGFADPDPAYVAALPFRDLSGRQTAV